LGSIGYIIGGWVAVCAVGSIRLGRVVTAGGNISQEACCIGNAGSASVQVGALLTIGHNKTAEDALGVQDCIVLLAGLTKVTIIAEQAVGDIAEGRAAVFF
jgi:hypothetical protein